MNERIKELAIQVQRTEMPGVLLADPEFVDRFAELIVRECARVADASNQMKNRPVGVSVGDVVLKNFGVKE